MVFTGGVGERAAALRAEAAGGLAMLGVALDPQRNADAITDADISAGGAAVRSLVIGAREDLQIAREVRERASGRSAAMVRQSADGDAWPSRQSRGLASTTAARSPSMSRPFRLGGIVAGLVLVVFGVGAIVIGLAGRHEVSTNIKREQIVGTPDMKPSLIAQKAEEAGLKNVTLPTCDVAGKPITNGGEAKCFASYMRIHALEATGGKTYAQMPQYATADGKGTDEQGRGGQGPQDRPPQSNQARQVWISETALGTALNTSFFASRSGCSRS